MLCYRCGTHSPDTAQKCPTCGQALTGSGGQRSATGTFSRRRATTGTLEGAPFKPQDLVAERYLIKDVVGAGPVGFVFRAHDKEVDVEVALKLVNPRLLQSADERKQFGRALRLARKLSHPNVVRVYEEGEAAEWPWFSSQFLDGLTLRKIIDLRLQKGQFFSLAEVEPILSQVAAALDGAHKLGPHSDLKPENVLVLPDLLKVTDFGLGLALPRLPFVQAQKARKADRYLAPEFIAGGEIAGSADIYSLGVIFGEMLSGLTPDGAVPELTRRNPQLPPQVEGIYRRALNSNPNARHRTAGEFIFEVSALAKRAAPPPPPLPKPEPATGIPSIPRARVPSGMLELSPRREKPPPPLPSLHEMPARPPPPPVAPGEFDVPETAREDGKDKEETAVINSDAFIAALQDDAETAAMVETVAPPPPLAMPMASPPPSAFMASSPGGVKRSATWFLVSLLIFCGVGVGAGGAYYLIQRKKALLAELPPPQPVVVTPQPVIDDGDIEAARVALAKQEAEKAAAEKAAADKAVAEKAAADRAAEEKARAEAKVAVKTTPVKGEKSAAAEALRRAMEEAAARAAEEKRAAEEAKKAEAAEKKREAAERAAAEKAAAKEREKEKATAAAAVANPAGDGTTCPDGMRPVAAGAFKMGTAPGDPMMGFDEKPLTSMELGGYCIDTWEYPNKRGASPTASISWADAKRLCEAQKKRLCSEPEWEKACKGPGNAKWPYGGSFNADTCNTEDDVGEARSIAKAGSFAKCKSVYGVSDMSGNVGEWTEEKVVKGGSYASGDYAVRCSARKAGASISRSPEIGFRCCADMR